MTGRRTATACGAALALMAAACPGVAASPADPAPARTVPDLLRQESSILDALDAAVFEARKADSTARAAESGRRAAEARLAAAEATLEQARAREDAARTRLAGTLRLLRVAGPLDSGTVQVLLGDDDRLARHAALLGRLSRRQAAEVATLADAVRTAEAAGFRAGIERAAAWALARAGQDAKTRLEEDVARHRAILDALDRDAGLQSRRAAEIDAAGRELARTIAERRREGRGPVDFDRRKGRVKPPLAGARIAVPFGDVVHPRFHTRTPHPGLTLEFPGTQPRNVRAAAFGRVAWVGRMRGLGSTVLVDHASGWFSVYGGLDEVDVAEGAVVREGDVLGRAGPDPGVPGVRVYFELRRDATAVDPRPYLAM